jgi:hypothetical protein
MSRPDLSRVPEWYHRYINQVEGDDLLSVLRKQGKEFVSFLENIPEEKRDHRYAEGKWSIREVLQHIIDAERIFSYRALCFARQDKTPLPGFDENSYAGNAKADKRKWDDLVDEFKTVRHATEILFGSFDAEQLNTTGVSSSKPVYVLALGFIIAGHANHHITITKERYL